MARSVSTPRGVAHVAYASFDSGDSDDFSFARNNFRDAIIKAFPSASECDEWPGDEDRAVAKNRFAYFGVSEYCGLVAMWVLPKDDDYATSYALRDRWIEQIEKRFRDVAMGGAFGPALRKLGTASNGEAFFQPVDGVQRGDMGLGFTSKEGWL